MLVQKEDPDRERTVKMTADALNQEYSKMLQQPKQWPLNSAFTAGNLVRIERYTASFL